MIRRYLFILLILIPTIGWSQLLIGVKGGFSPLSTISFKPTQKSTPYYGEKPEFGIIIKYFDQKRFGLQGEVNFTHRGYNTPYKEIYKIRQVGSYVEIPVFTQMRFNIVGIYLHAQAGCFVAYMLNARQGVDTSGAMVLKKYTLDMLRDNRFDFGLIGGGGLSKEFKWGVIQVDVRIQYGYGDLYKHTYKDMPDQSKAIVQSVSISYMYNISNLGKKRVKDNNI
ncbi:MAG: PorT family protein [Bacteroidales bacterium]|nr:MAG: PorT family protein [Bacteroidales bacterium]